MNKRSRWIVQAACLAVAVAGLSACGSDEKASPKSTATGDPIYIGTTGAYSGANPYKESYTVIEAYFAKINAAGGINNRPLKLKKCDNQAVESMGTNCVKQLVNDKSIVAFVGSNNDPTMSRYQIANIGPQGQTPEDMTNKNSFPVWGAAINGSANIGASLYLKDLGTKTPFVITCDTVCGPFADSVKKLYPDRDVKTAEVPLGEGNLTSPILAAKNAKADAVYIGLPTPGIVGSLTAAKNANYSPQWVLSYSCFDQKVLDLLPPGSENTVCPTPFKDWDGPAMDELLTTMKDYGPSDWGNKSFIAIGSYLASEMLSDSLKSIGDGDVTRASVLKAMNGLTFTSDFLAAPLDFTKPGPDPTFPAVRNTKVFLTTAKDKTFEYLQKEPVDVAPS